MGKLFEELKRRKVFRVAAVYAVVAWVLIQVADTVLPALQMPDWTVSFVTVLFILGFPIAVILSWAYEASPEGIKPDYHIQAGSGPQATSAQPINYLILLIVLLVAGFQLADRLLLDPSVSDVQSGAASIAATTGQAFRANIALGESQINTVTGMHGYIAISPDGRRIAYTNWSSNDLSTTSILNLETGATQLIAASNSRRNLLRPIFSPSSESLLLTHRIPGPDEIIITNANGDGGRIVTASSRGSAAIGWLTEQSLIYVPDGQDVFHTISVNGGSPTALSIPGGAQYFMGLPTPVPDSPWMLYTFIEGANTSTYDATINAFNLETNEVRTLLSRGYDARYAPSGHIVFMREGDLWAVPFNKARMELMGEQVMIEQEIEHNSIGAGASFAFSDAGRLIYRKGPDGFRARDEQGQELRDIDGDLVANAIPPNAIQGRFSPTGDRIVFTLLDRAGQNSDIAVYDIASQALSRRTFGGQIDRPLWTPDGNQLVYRQRDPDSFGLWLINSDGSGQPEQLVSAPVSVSPTSFSADGQQLVFTQGVGGEGQIKLLSLQEIESPIQDLFTSAYLQDTAEISPDGRWIVYMSNELNGMRTNFVRPFPNVDDGKWMLADIPSGEAHWGPDGSLYFIRDDGTIYHVEVDTQDGFSTGRPELILTSQWTGRMEPNFGISPDGKQILYTKPRVGAVVQTDTLVLVENWFERLKQLAPPIHSE